MTKFYVSVVRISALLAIGAVWMSLGLGPQLSTQQYLAAWLFGCGVLVIAYAVSILLEDNP